MDIYQVATEFWDQSSDHVNPTSQYPSVPDETPPFDPRPEVPVPTGPEETPPYEQEPETPPMQPEPELPPVEPVVPEIDPLPGQGQEPEIPALY